MKIRRESVRSSGGFSRSPRRSAAKELRAPRKTPLQRAAKRAPRRAAHGVSRAVHAIRDNPGKSLIILGMIAIVAIVTVVVLVLPPPSMEVDISNLLGEENVAGQATAIKQGYLTNQPGTYHTWSISGSGADDYR